MLTFYCTTFLEDNDIPSLIKELKYYLNDSDFDNFYPVGMRLKFEQILNDYDGVNLFFNRDPTVGYEPLRMVVQEILSDLNNMLWPEF